VGPQAEQVISPFAVTMRHALARQRVSPLSFHLPTAASDVVCMLGWARFARSLRQAASAKPSIFQPAAIMERRRPDMNLRVASMPPVRGQSWPV
jgi:hypothetical protein